MNDKIENLKKQCKIGQDSDMAYDMEKFAELIVSMCADAADMAYEGRCDSIGDYVVEQLGFGIERGAANWRYDIG